MAIMSIAGAIESKAGLSASSISTTRLVMQTQEGINKHASLCAHASEQAGVDHNAVVPASAANSGVATPGTDAYEQHPDSLNG